MRNGIRLASEKSVYFLFYDKEEERESWRFSILNILSDLQRPKVFGVGFEEMMAGEMESSCPQIVRSCIQSIKNSNYEVNGILTTIPTSSDTAQLIVKINRGEITDLSDVLSNNGSLALFLLRKWLQELPEPLSSFPLYPSFLNYNGSLFSSLSFLILLIITFLFLYFDLSSLLFN